MFSHILNIFSKNKTMKIVIAGAGDVGVNLIDRLSREDHDIVVIETEQRKIERLQNQFDVAIINGSNASPKILQQAGVNSSCDLFVSVANQEEMNILACVFAKRLGAKKVISRIRNVEFHGSKPSFDLHSLDIDEFISPDSLAAQEIEKVLDLACVSDIYDFDNGLFSLVSLTIHQGDTLCGSAVEHIESYLSRGLFRIIAIKRHGRTLFPRPTHSLEPLDQIYVLVKREGLSALLELYSQKTCDIQRVMILGAGKVGIYTAMCLRKRYRVTILERDPIICERIAAEFSDALVINGDSNDPGTLEEADISEMDAFVATTGDAETNIVSCLVAKRNGVDKTISLVKDSANIQFAYDIGIDTIVNKKMIAAMHISRHIHKGNVLALLALPGLAAEITEYRLEENARIIGKSLKKIHSKKREFMHIGGVIRNNKAIIPTDDFVFEHHDKIIMSCHSGCTKYSRLFS